MASTKGSARQVQKSSLLKVVLLGNGGVGKSCLMNRFVHNTFDDGSYHTIGVEFLNKDIVLKGEIYTLQIWDTAGQERFRSLRAPFYRGADICILTYSIDDRKSFEDLIMWKKEFLHYADVKEPASFPFIVIGNKADISPEIRQVDICEGEAWSRDKSYPFTETSAKDAVNVEQAFHSAVESWLKTEEKLDSQCISNTVDLNKLSAKKGCC